jgi:hypothetical protein
MVSELWRVYYFVTIWRVVVWWRGRYNVIHTIDEYFLDISGSAFCHNVVWWCSGQARTRM